MTFIQIGQIVGAFGLKGQVKVQPMTDFLDRFKKGSRLRLKGEWVEVESFSIHKGRPLVKLRGIDDVSTAETLQWEYLETAETGRPELDDDEFLTQDLIGLVVTTVDGILLGKIDDVVTMPAHDVIQIGELLIPAVKEFVKDVDLEAGTMTVELIPGMLPE
ncbi:MAG: ribosome maturation factor RimM [Fimbriimonas sp.]|nr:ribosome maturation factor RimM [Fimbriimonas sp.]